MPIEELIEQCAKIAESHGGYAAMHPVFAAVNHGRNSTAKKIAANIRALAHPTPTAADTPEHPMRTWQEIEDDKRAAESMAEGYRKAQRAAAADTGLVERLTAELERTKQQRQMLQGNVEDLERAAEQREAAAREQIAALEREVWRLQSKLSEVFDYDARDSAK